MSGGRWNYAGFRIRGELNEIGHDGYARDKWPLTTAAFQALAEPLESAEHKMDYVLSADYGPEKANDREMFGALLEALMKIAPDEWFPRGKWATIQAVQGRIAEGTAR